MQVSSDPLKPSKSKAELRRERRELQEAQRAAKMAAKGAKQTSTVAALKCTPELQSDANVRPLSDRTRQQKQKQLQQKEFVLESQPSISSQPTTPNKSQAATNAPAASGGQQALGVMRMDDPAHFKKSVRQLHKKKLQPRPQEPVRVNLFCHLSQPDKRVNVLGQHKLGITSSIHPFFLRLGLELDEGRVTGSNRRCLEFLRATAALILNFNWEETPGIGGSLARAFHTYFDRHVTFLDQCRPLPVTVRSAVQYIKIMLHRLDEVNSPEEMKSRLLDAVGNFMDERVHLADRAIANLVAESVPPGGVVCVFGESTVVAKALQVTWETRHQNFTVLVVDCRPRCEGRRMFLRLRKIGIPCEIVHIAALPMVAPKVSLTLLGAHSLLSNGYVIATMGTAHVANIVASVAHTPVMVCAETYKFWERAQSDAFEFNELGDPDEIWRGPRGTAADWRVPKDPDFVVDKGTHPEAWRELSQRADGLKNLRLLNLVYDVIPPELVSAVITELGILPTTSIPVVLRVKQASIEATNSFISTL
uniref:Translation initiation factor eIF2B subunit delta n=1 Tax=Echinococcus granulosus TaxID=6210 RepID=A0A068WKI8_ECHGR|nr:translation initiation factor eIF 2B subunit [Echinococcus granulosus]